MLIPTALTIITLVFTAGTIQSATIHALTNKLEELQERLEDAEAEDNLELVSELENEIDDLEHSEHYSEIFQYFIISAQGASILEEYTNEIVYYNETLDLYVWGVTHWGTSWDYVLTDIPCERSEKA